jgi:Zn-dependent protease with chaperone function
MSPGAEPAAERQPRLNPFAFPSDTTFRFVLLVLAVLGATLYVWQWIYFAAGVDGSDYLAKSRECTALAPPPGSRLDAYLGLDNSQAVCVRDLNRPMAWWMLGGVALVIVLAVALTMLQPWWQARKRRLQPLEEADAPAVHAEVRALAAEAELPEVPELAWDPLDPAPSGLAFGRVGRYTVALTGGLVVKQITDPDAFRAVVRHELAHIRNRDVDLAYFTVSLWHAFLLGAVAPFGITLLDESWETVGRVTWRLLALAALVYLTRNAVLRAREVYADVRASTSQAGGAAIRRVLAGLPSQGGARWRRLLRVHPDPTVRLALVDDPTPLFGLGLLTAFGAGVAATTSYQSVFDAVSGFASETLDARFIAAVAFAPAVIGVVGVGIWRSTFAALAQSRRPPHTFLLGLALAAGFLVGPELALEGTVASGDDALLASLVHGRGVFWVLGLLAALSLLLAWIRAGAIVWLRALGARRSRAVTWVALLAAAGVLVVVMGIFYVTRDARAALTVTEALTSTEHAVISQLVWALPEWLYRLLTDGLLLWALLRLEVLAALLVVIGLPLAATLLPNRIGAADGSWAFLDPGGRLALPEPVPRPVRALGVGGAGAAVGLAGLLLIRLGIHFGIAESTRPQLAFLFAFFAWQLALALAVQAGTAAVAAALSAGQRVLDGMLAALIAGSVTWFGIVAGPTVGGCVGTLSVNPGPCSWDVGADFAFDTYRRVVEQGAVAAIAAGLATSGVMALVGRARRGAATPARAAAAS